MANTAKTAIVTGASRGIGAGLVEAFLKRGYSVVANSRHIPEQIHSPRLRILRWSMETSAIEARPRRSWTLSYRSLAVSTC